MDLVVQISRYVLLGKTDEIFSHDRNSDTGRCHVFLHACIDQTEFRYIDLFGQDAGGHVCYERDISCVRDVRIVCSVDRIVQCDMYIISIRTEIFSVHLRNIGESGIFRRCYDLDIAEFFCFFGSFLSPCSCDDIVSLAGLAQQVQRNHGKLQCTASLDEHYLVIVRDIHDVTQVLFCIGQNRLEFSGSVAHFHYGFPTAFIVCQISSYIFDHR